MDYGVPLSLGLLGLAIIAFVLWEMFRKPKDEPDKRALMRAIAGEMKLDASTIIDLPEGKTLDEVPVLWCYTPEGQKVIRERVARRAERRRERRAQERAIKEAVKGMSPLERMEAEQDVYYGGKNMREMG